MMAELLNGPVLPLLLLTLPLLVVARSWRLPPAPVELHGYWRNLAENSHLRMAAVALVPGLSCLSFSSNGEVLAASLFGWGLVWLAFHDLSSLRLPDRGTMSLIFLGIAASLLLSSREEWQTILFDRSLAVLLAWGLMLAVALLYRHLRGSDGLGAGDAKLFAAIAAWTGLADLGLVLLVAAGGALMMVTLLDRWRGDNLAGAPIPLGAFLAAAGFGVYLAPGWGALEVTFP